MKEISYEELLNWKENGKNFFLIDVREDIEHEMFNIGGTLIPLGEIMKRKDEIEDIDIPVVIYCKRGIRSLIAIQRLSPFFKLANFYNLKNGIYEQMK